MTNDADKMPTSCGAPHPTDPNIRCVRMGECLGGEHLGIKSGYSRQLGRIIREYIRFTSEPLEKRAAGD